MVAPAFAAWREAFWDNLASSIQLHGIRALIAVNHGNCGAIGIAYGERVLKDPGAELTAHLVNAKRLHEELAVRHPELGFQAWYVYRDYQGAFTQWKALVEGPLIS